ncbi:MAG: DUF2851 family protein, partial [Dehalococcoidia bacterium]
MYTDPTLEAEGGVMAGKATQLPQLPERLLAHLWQQRALRGGAVLTGDGRRLQVLYPGRPGTEAGPDFRDALLQDEGGRLLRGDVEVHTRASGWRAHGHHRDARYNSVVLHVVQQAGTGEDSSPLASGGTTPVATLEPHREGPPNPFSGLWELLGLGEPFPQTATALGQLLNRTGDLRFLGKSQAFHHALPSTGAEQLLYEALMEGLGYSRNRAPFRELARRLPLCYLRHATIGLPQHRRWAALQVLLLWASGLEARQPGVEHLLARLGSPPQPLQRDQWCLFRLRPTNHPVQRLRGAARLLGRYLDTGLLRGLLPLVRRGSPNRLLTGLIVRDQAECTLIGPGRAGDLVVNAVLPLLHALASLRRERELARRCLALYHTFPPLQENGLTREMATQLVPR